VKTVAFLLLCSTVLGGYAQGSRVSQAGGRVVEMSLVRADDLSPEAWPEGKSELKQVPAVLKPDNNLYVLLEKNGIAPDAEAFALVYDLNPHLNDANKIASSTPVVLPAIAGDADIVQALEAGHLVELTLDPQIRAELMKNIESLQPALMAAEQADWTPEPKAQAEHLVTWFQQIEKRLKRRTAPPLRQASLIELQDEAGLLSRLLESAGRQHRTLSNEEQKAIADIYDDVEAEMRYFGETLSGTMPTTQAFYAVTVNIKGMERSRLENLRVYYTYNGLYRILPAEPPIPSFGFKQVGSGKSENLLMKNYQIWAAKDGDANHPVTQTYLLRIESSTPTALSVDLTPISGSHP